MRRMRKRLKRTGIIFRADQRERFTLAVEGVQIKQCVVRGEQRTQHIGDPVFEILRDCCWPQIAVQITIA